MIASLVSFVSRLSKREKAVFYGVLVVAAVLLLDRLMLRPMLTKMMELDKKTVEIETSIKRAMGIVAREEELRERAGKYERYLTEPGSDDLEKLSLDSLKKEIEMVKELQTDRLSFKGTQPARSAVDEAYAKVGR